MQYLTHTPRTIVPDEHLATAVAAALDAHGVAPSAVVISLVFGSFARSDFDDHSDVDLIHLCWPDSLRDPIQFIRLHDSTRSIDTNAILIDRLPECFNNLNWSYRFYHARPITNTNTRPTNEIRNWLTIFNRLIASSPACWQRANTHLRHLKQLRTIMAQSDASSLLRCFLLSEIEHLAPSILLDNAQHVPFSTRRNPRDEVPAIESPSAALAAYKQLVTTMETIVLHTSDPQPMGFGSPERAKRLRRFLRRAIEADYPDALGQGYLFLVTDSASRVSRVTHTLDRLDRIRCIVSDQLVDRVRHLCDACDHDLDIARTALPNYAAAEARAPSLSKTHMLGEWMLPWKSLSPAMSP